MRSGMYAILQPLTNISFFSFRVKKYTKVASYLQLGLGHFAAALSLQRGERVPDGLEQLGF